MYHFRRTFELDSKPSSFLIHVTADNRYQLFVNGERVAWGPARGDLFHWRYESVDIARFLRAGKNTLAAVVWNDGRYRAVAQISNRTGFLLQGDTAREEVVNTGPRWVGVEDEAYQPIPIARDQVHGYVAVPPGEEVDGSRYPWGWEQPYYDDSAWQPVEAGRGGSPRDTIDAPSRWFLAPRSIPMMEEKPERLARRPHFAALRGGALGPRQARERPSRRYRGQGIQRLPGRLHCRRRRAPALASAVLAHLPVRGADDSDQGAAAYRCGPPRRLHRLPVRPQSAL